MNKVLLIFFCTTLIYSNLVAQNVGIGKPNPNERLDVNGSINLSNQLKINGDSGRSNQVLKKDASNNLVWGDLSNYTHMKQFTCTNTRSTATPNDCSATWVVPVGVTTAFIECWGGGGGGCSSSGGGGGAYVSAKFPVVAGQTISLTIGAKGLYGSTTSNGYSGGISSATLGSNKISAGGGGGGNSGDVSIVNTQFFDVSNGGNYYVTGFTQDYYGLTGNYGNITKVSFQQADVTEFARVINYGDGADAVFFPGSGGKGGYTLKSTTNLFRASGTFLAGNGAGGAADYHYGELGGSGMVIIRW